MLINCFTTSYYHERIKIETRIKEILLNPLPRVEIPELNDLLNGKEENGGEEESNNSRLSLVKSTKNWKWTTGEINKKRMTKSSTPITNNENEESNHSEDVSGGYKPIGKDDSDNSAEEPEGYTTFNVEEEKKEKKKEEKKEENNEENNEELINEGGGYTEVNDNEEDNVNEAGGYTSYKNEEKNNRKDSDSNISKLSESEDKNDEDIQDGYMIIEEESESEIENEEKKKNPKILSKSDHLNLDDNVSSSPPLNNLNTSATNYSDFNLKEPQNSSEKQDKKKHGDSSDFDYQSFNNRFQNLIEKLDEQKKSQDTEELQNTNMKLIQLAQDFVASATIYGKLIISEHMMPEHMRTIKPTKKVGGYLGGEKYIVNDILFKFAKDAHGIFKHLKNVDQDPLWAANKVAGHELKGCIDYFRARTDGLSFPLVQKKKKIYLHSL